MSARFFLPMAALLFAFAAAQAAETKAATDQTSASTSTADDAGKGYAAFIAANTTQGPAKIPVRVQAVIDLPEGFAFLPEAPARDFMKTLGNRTDPNFVGLVVPGKDEGWFVIVEYHNEGYVKDDDAANWNVDDMLKDIRNKTDEDNILRRRNKIPELNVIGWVEPPHYDKATHRLIWSIAACEQGVAAEGDVNINYRTLALGREGYVAMNLVTSQRNVARDKVKVHLLLSKLSFTDGKRYGDFNASTDKIAEYGLAALIGGVVVKKLGLIALIGAFLVKGVKFLVVIGVGALALLRRRFGRKKDNGPADTKTSLLDTPPSPSADEPKSEGPFSEG